MCFQVVPDTTIDFHRINGFWTSGRNGLVAKLHPGNEPAAAYDNWLSHVVEGVAEEGGVNDYIPEELDPQTNGFGEFQFISEEDADSALSQWHSIFGNLE